MESRHDTSTAHEVRDAEVRPILWTSAALVVMVAVVSGLMVALFYYMAGMGAEQRVKGSMSSSGPQIPPVPRIEEHPAIEIKTLRANEDRILSSYGWVDRKAGRVRIPIDRAIDLQLERGFPTRKEPVPK